MPQKRRFSLFNVVSTSVFEITQNALPSPLTETGMDRSEVLPAFLLFSKLKGGQTGGFGVRAKINLLIKVLGCKFNYRLANLQMERGGPGRWPRCWGYLVWRRTHDQQRRVFILNNNYNFNYNEIPTIFFQKSFDFFFTERFSNWVTLRQFPLRFHSLTQLMIHSSLSRTLKPPKIKLSHPTVNQLNLSVFSLSMVVISKLAKTRMFF